MLLYRSHTHTHQSEFANTSWPALVCRVKAALYNFARKNCSQKTLKTKQDSSGLHLDFCMIFVCLFLFFFNTVV